MNPTSRPTVSLTANERGASVSKFLVCLQQADGNPFAAAELAERQCRSAPAVEHTFRQKSAVGAGTTAATGWATELAAYGIGGEAFGLLQSASILGRLSPSFRRVPFRTKFPKETGAGAGGSWKGEGLPIPVARTTFDTLTQEYAEADVIVVVTRELFTFGAVSEAALRAAVIAGIAKFVDQQLLDRTVGPTAAHPASLTYGTQVLTSAGTTAANIITDLSALLAEIQSPGDALRWVMKPMTFYQIAAKLGGVGLTVTPDNLLGIPCVLGSTSPQQIALIDAANVAYSTDGVLAVDVTTKADVQMDGAPTQSGVSGTGSTMVSLFQSAMVGVRAALPASWQHIHYGTSSPTVPAGAAVMAVSY